MSFSFFRVLAQQWLMTKVRYVLFPILVIITTEYGNKKCDNSQVLAVNSRERRAILRAARVVIYVLPFARFAYSRVRMPIVRPFAGIPLNGRTFIALQILACFIPDPRDARIILPSVFGMIKSKHVDVHACT